MNNFKKYLKEKIELTLQHHDKLNSKFWDEDKLKPDVRKHLLMIANKWAIFSKIPKKGIKEIILTGGNANYNYTKFSDLDVHLIVDFSTVSDCEKDFVGEFLVDKKTVWELTHDITIFGTPVEVFAHEDRPHKKSQGVYSLTKDKWLQEPKKEEIKYEEDDLLKSKVEHHIHMINYALKHHTDDVSTLKKMKDRIKGMRDSAIQKAGEFSIENLVFKELRNRGILDKMSDHIRDLQDRKLSLKRK
jgi:predicted nucleotidyltransferase|tara:strand:+ start:296 stop:1030 length:735 start_codon:yes stop_codon:yes gene_type:complete